MANISVLGRAGRRAGGVCGDVNGGGAAAVEAAEAMIRTPEEAARRMRNIDMSPAEKRLRLAEAQYLVLDILERTGYRETVLVYRAMLSTMTEVVL